MLEIKKKLTFDKMFLLAFYVVYIHWYQLYFNSNSSFSYWFITWSKLSTNSFTESINSRRKYCWSYGMYIYLCQNEDYCQTTVFNELTLQCTLFEECSTVGRIVTQIGSMLISFLLCDREPKYLTFSPPLKTVLLATPLPNITVLSISTTYDIVMMGNYLYMSRDYSNYFKIYDTDTYIPLNNSHHPSMEQSIVLTKQVLLLFKS